jgi:hypothetical protein
MTPGESTTSVAVDATTREVDPDDRDDGAAPHRMPPDDRRPAGRGAAAVLAVAVLVPLALFTWRALHAPINFDGGMNLQVAQRLAGGQGYTRFYDELLTFPHEVQTNGPYMYLAALAIKVFGPGQLAYQFANLVFIAGFSAVVSLMLAREGLVLRVAGPALVLIAVPVIHTYGLGGLGEVPTTFFLFTAVLALVEAVRSPERAPWFTLGGSIAFGAAIATKTFSVGASGAMAVALLCVVLAAPTRRLRGQVLLISGAGVLVIAARELHRLAELGSIGGYRAWWSDQSSSISSQSGLDGAEGSGPVQTFLDHAHVLSGLFDFPAELLVVILFVPLVWVGALVLCRWRRQGLRTTLTDPHTVMVLAVGMLAASYILWWLLIVPEEKLWIRRIIPGMLSLHLLYLFMAAWLVRVGQAAWRAGDRDEGGPAPRMVVGAALAALVVVAATMGPYASIKVAGNTGDLLGGEQAWLDANRDAAAHIEAHAEHQFYGDEWWSAPVVSLMAQTDFLNLGASDFCGLDLERDRLVWDSYAKSIRSQDPWTRDGRLVFDEVESFGTFITIYAVGPAPGTCG